jgi:hypothetical protein
MWARCFQVLTSALSVPGRRLRGASRFIDLLNHSTAGKLLTSELGRELGKPWGKVSFAVLTPEFFRALGGLGWRYVSRKGRGGSYFERVRTQVALAA